MSGHVPLPPPESCLPPSAPGGESRPSFLQGTLHVCDINCDQQFVYDNYRYVCRLSGRFFDRREVDEYIRNNPQARQARPAVLWGGGIARRAPLTAPTPSRLSLAAATGSGSTRSLLTRSTRRTRSIGSRGFGTAPPREGSRPLPG